MAGAQAGDLRLPGLPYNNLKTCGYEPTPPEKLQPDVIVSGHGHAMRGSEMRSALQQLAREFDTIAVPEKGRYVRESELDRGA